MEEELHQKIASDSEWSRVPADWHLKAEAVMQKPKKLLSLRLDGDVLDWFKSQGTGRELLASVGLGRKKERKILR
jgi:uncharacterized protein (DUF4415 family)